MVLPSVYLYFDVYVPLIYLFLIVLFVYILFRCVFVSAKYKFLVDYLAKYFCLFNFSGKFFDLFVNNILVFFINLGGLFGMLCVGIFKNVGIRVLVVVCCVLFIFF